MKKCKFYSDYICNHYGNGLCHYSEKVFGSSMPESCNHINDFENCTCFEPLEDKKEQLFKIGSSVPNQDLICSDCERVIFIGKKLGNVAEIDADKISKIDSIEVNGIKFKKV